MGKADLHAHTSHNRWGDGNQTVEELFEWVEEKTDLDLFGITDHDNTQGARAGQEMHRRGNYRFTFVPGVEVTNQSGHLLCYFPRGDIVDIPSLRPFRWTLDYAHRHGAICVVAHPLYPPWLFRTLRKALLDQASIEAVETVNAGIGEKAQLQLTAIGREFEPLLAVVGNSDAHYQRAIGSGYTAFPGHTLDEFLVALSDRATKPVCVSRTSPDPEARRFTTRRSMTRPGWVGNIWREIRREGSIVRPGSSED